MADLDRAPTIEKVVQRHILAALDELHTCLPGVVTDYDATTQRASVKPLVRHAYLDEQGQRQTESLGVVPGVPVQFMAAGGFVLTCPISDGKNGLGDATTGLLIFSEASLDRWLSGAGQEVDPGIDHRHALTDAVFIPGLQPFGAPLANVPADRARFGDPDGARYEATTGGQAIINGGSTPVAKEGSGTTGHTHIITGTAGPYPLTATIQTATDAIAAGQGSPTVKVP